MQENNTKNIPLVFQNPFKPGAGHMPPYLAGREEEKTEFKRLLQQQVILDNLILTGLRGIGKTVLLETLKPIAISHNWLWTGSNLSETTSISESATILRILTDLSLVTSGITVNSVQDAGTGFAAEAKIHDNKLNLETLISIYEHQPGLAEDKLRAVLEFAWVHLRSANLHKGVIFAYDEAQNMSDHAERDQYPLSLLLDVFQAIQRKGVPFMLVLVGLPTLFPKLVEARTYSERMFRVLSLTKLSPEESREAIIIPIENTNCPVQFNEESINVIIKASGGYPYFIQFICREVYDVFLQKNQSGEDMSVPLISIVTKLDTDFFSGRWARATDRQRDLLRIIANLKNSDDEFTVAEIVVEARKQNDLISSSHINQMLGTLIDAGLIYKNRYGKYSFAVPLMGQFIKRQEWERLSKP